MNYIQGSNPNLLREVLEKPHCTQKSGEETISQYLTIVEPQLSLSSRYLSSEDSAKSMEIDPYWPKWNSPWWHMTLFYEMGLAKDIPYMSLELLESALEKKYLHFFPFSESEVPAGFDPIAHVLCQCALGTAHRILHHAGRDTSNMPWIREWFVKYQLPDGGYNCDETVYTNNGKSSMISTVHLVESLLEYDDLNETETQVLDRAVDYLLKRRLLHSLSKADQIIDSNWISITFPRFYEIDILRTLNCVARWSKKRNKVLPWSAIAEVVSLMHEKSRNSELTVEREFYKSCNTRVRNADGSWQPKQESSVFPLLEAVGTKGAASPFLVDQWLRTVELLKHLNESKLLSTVT
ncbi:MAG: hypothetical protein K2X93_27470 [Candidatus Obscuribacterales bacterium]|nr:hypothetical protein [Candidatus Obscuribacterales bacterium]